MVVLFKNELDHNSVDEILHELKGQLKEYDHIDFYFTTIGGEIVYANILTHFLNKNKDKITLHIPSYLHSAGILVPMGYEGKTIFHLDDIDYWLLHNIDMKVYNNRKEYGVSTQQLQKHLNRLNKKFYKQLSKFGVSDKHIENLKKGKDVILYQKDIKKLKINRK